MKNQVIKVLNREHGKKVIEWFKAQGININGCSGSVTEEDGGFCIYYGVIDSFFSNYSLNYVKNNNAEIIELPIKEEFDMTTNEGRLAYAKKHYPIGTVIKSMHSGYKIELTGEPVKYGISNIMSYGNLPNNPYVMPYIYYNGEWAEIVKKEKNKIMETQKLSRAGLKEIHGVACSAWKMDLERYGARNPLEYYIELTQEEVDAMFKACTENQLPIVNKYLKEDNSSVDVTKFKVEGKGIIDDNKSSYAIRDRETGKYRKKSFLLSQWYDWEIKEDELGFLCLIPTKK